MKSGANTSDIKHIGELASLGWDITQIAEELDLATDMVEEFMPDNELRNLLQVESNLQTQIDSQSQALSEAVNATQDAENELPGIRSLLAGISRELSRYKLSVHRSNKDSNRVKKRLKKALKVVSDCEDEKQRIQSTIDDFKQQLSKAESDTSAYHTQAQEEQKLAGLSLAKQRTASELARMAIENAVGDKLEEIIREKL